MLATCWSNGLGVGLACGLGVNCWWPPSGRQGTGSVRLILLLVSLLSVAALSVNAPLGVFIHALLVIGLTTVLATLRLHWQLDHIAGDTFRFTEHSH